MTRPPPPLCFVTREPGPQASPEKKKKKRKRKRKRIKRVSRGKGG
jgi:hypothetical protein